MTTNQFIELLWRHVFSWCGAPLRIIGDRDTRLTSSRMKALVKGLGAKLALSAGYHPQTDGSTERFNRTFLTMLRICCRKSPRTAYVSLGADVTRLCVICLHRAEQYNEAPGRKHYRHPE